MVNEILSLSSLSHFSLLVYQNERDSWILILYSAAIRYSLISSSNFLLTSLLFAVWRVMSSSKRKKKKFQSVFLLLPFSLIAVSRTNLKTNSNVFFTSERLTDEIAKH